jgi:tripartite-type tricarboxylate transporter receptor subunit TctC
MNSTVAGYLGWIATAVALLGATSTSPADEFYRDKTLSIVIGTAPGGSYDLYGRTIAAHLGKHIPGKPSVNVEFMPGAGGVVAGNYIYGIGPQDGTKILLAHPLPMMEKLQSGSGIRFDSGKFQWLGAYDAIGYAFLVWHTVAARTAADIVNADIVIGALAKGHTTYQGAALVKDALDAKFKIVAGYRSGTDLNLALERGEVHGEVLSWDNIAGTRPQWIKDKLIHVPMQLSLERLRALKDVPTLLELAPPNKRDMVKFYGASTPLARTMAAGPDVPADRGAVLRKAFDDLMKDADFLAEADKRKLGISPRNAAAVSALVHTVMSAPPDLVSRLKDVLGGS